MLSSTSPSSISTTDSIMMGRHGQPIDLNVRKLTALAVSGLVKMFDSEKQLFCFRLKQSGGRLVREGLSTRYTIISLLGLHRLESTGFQSPIQTRTVLDVLLRDLSCVTNIGDLGLTLWLCALASPERLEEVYSNFNVRGALSDFREAREGRTLDLAWFLSGLAHAGSISGQLLPGLCDLATRTHQLLMENQGAGGTFGHLFRTGTIAGVLRGRIGSFADQVYPIYALAKFARVFQVHAALAPAQRCADAICKAQGALGEWWWHYHSQTGGVLEHYPVYAVHQHGMAPMALFALTDATQIDFREPIYKGLRWVAGDNKMAVDLRAVSSGVVWRGLYNPRTDRKYLGKALAFLRFGATESAEDLKIRFECRSYELGWLLYAFAGRSDY